MLRVVRRGLGVVLTKTTSRTSAEVRSCRLWTRRVPLNAGATSSSGGCAGEKPVGPKSGEKPVDANGCGKPADPKGGEKPVVDNGCGKPADPEGGERSKDNGGGQNPTGKIDGGGQTSGKHLLKYFEKFQRDFRENAKVFADYSAKKMAKLQQTFKFERKATTFDQIEAAFKSTDFLETLKSAPPLVLRTVIGSAAPLAVSTLVAAVTLTNTDGYLEPFVTGYVSNYVVFANGLWLHHLLTNGHRFGSRDEVYRAVAPAAYCFGTVILSAVFPGDAFINLISQVLLLNATNTMCGRIVLADDPSIPQWTKSLVLVVYAICVPSLVVAMISTIFG